MKFLTVLLFLNLGAVVFATGAKEMANPEKMDKDRTMQQAAEPADTMLSDTEQPDVMMSDSMRSATGGKKTFTTLEEAVNIAALGPTVLFFNADWCPTCRAALQDLETNNHRLGDVTVLIVNYDTERALKKKYGIVYQHTFVQIDTAGKKTAVWSGGGVETILKRVVRAGKN